MNIVSKVLRKLWLVIFSTHSVANIMDGRAQDVTLEHWIEGLSYIVYNNATRGVPLSKVVPATLRMRDSFYINKELLGQIKNHSNVAAVKELAVLVETHVKDVIADYYDYLAVTCNGSKPTSEGMDLFLGDLESVLLPGGRAYSLLNELGFTGQEIHALQYHFRRLHAFAQIGGSEDYMISRTDEMLGLEETLDWAFA